MRPLNRDSLPHLARHFPEFGIPPMQPKGTRMVRVDTPDIKRQLEKHLRAITVRIGERGLFTPERLEMTAAYIASAYEEMGLPFEFEEYHPQFPSPPR